VFAEYFEDGGPVMYAVLATWVVVLAGVLDRLLYALGRAWRRPGRQIAAHAALGKLTQARACFAREQDLAVRGLERIDSTSQLATSIGLFGTVLGIAQSFLERGTSLQLAAPEVLASGLSTALYTTLAGLVVFLFGQAFLIAYTEWQAACERGFARTLGLAEEPA